MHALDGKRAARIGNAKSRLTIHRGSMEFPHAEANMLRSRTSSLLQGLRAVQQNHCVRHTTLSALIHRVGCDELSRYQTFSGLPVMGVAHCYQIE